MRNLPQKIKVYIITIYVVTVVLFALFLYLGLVKLGSINIPTLLFFSVLIALTESFTVLFRKISFSTTFAVELAAFILFGPAFTIIAIMLGFSLRIVKMNEDKYKHILNSPLYGTIFNYCVLILPLLIANYAYQILGGNFVFIGFNSNLFQIIVFSLISFLINTFLISILSAFANGKHLIFTFLSNLKLVLINFIIMVPFGLVLAYVYKQTGYLGVLFFLFPVIMVRYTFSLYIDSKTQFIQTVDSLMRAVEARDKYTEGHSQRVAKIVEMIAKEMKFNELKIEQLNMGSLMHDVGKIGIDDSILNKPGKLTKDEFNIIKQHPEIGFNILKDIKNLQGIFDLVRHHHERYDGKGYPDGKNKDQLSIDVFIIQLADAVDAMGTDRPYRSALSEEEIFSEVRNNMGTQFHPEVVEAFFRAMEKNKLAGK